MLAAERAFKNEQAQSDTLSEAQESAVLSLFFKRSAKTCDLVALNEKTYFALYISNKTKKCLTSLRCSGIFLQ